MSVTEQSKRGEGVPFGPYRVYDRIGMGGMATVHRAKELGIEGFERWVALKRLLPHLAEDASFVRSFVREAKLASLLTHPNIVQIFELGRVGHVYFISMELIEGHDVRQILRQARRVTGPPPIAITIGILIQMCEALEYAHSRVDDEGRPLGLVHRDVSPSNVIVSQSGHLKIIDFGIAKAQTQQLQTNTGRVKGKMAYMSPESIRGLDLDGRSDIFSLGVLAHELLTARPLFATKNDYKTLQRVQNATVAPPSTFNRDCPPELDGIVLRALERDREERWQTAGEMQSELIRLRQSYGLSAQPRDLAHWMLWAFTVEAPPTGPKGPHRAPSQAPVETPAPDTGSPSVVIDPIPAASLRTPSSPHTPTTGAPKFPVADVALPIAEEDDEIVEIAWGGRSGSQAVLLDDVPDVSGRGSVATAGAQGQTTPVPDKSSATLIGPAPPPPPSASPKPPRHWATGTQPPGRDDEELVLERFPLGDDPGADISVPHPRKRASTSGPSARPRFVKTEQVPALPAPRAAREGPRAPTTRVGGATSIGHSIVVRERGKRIRLALGVLLAAAAAAAVYLLQRGGAADDPESAPVETSAVRLIFEPADAVATIDGVGHFEGSPARTRLAPGSYEVTISRDGYKAWSANLDVAEDERQTLRVVLASDASEQKSELVGAEVAATVSPDAEGAAEDDEPQGEEDEDDGERRRRRSVAPVIESPDQPLAAGGDDDAQTPARDFAVPFALGASEPPKTAARKPAATGPVVVPPNAVAKKRGTVPRLRARGADLPDRISAELCIDRRGEVTRVRLLTPVPGSTADALTDALSDWRYAPYRQDGKRRAACFAVNFRAR